MRENPNKHLACEFWDCGWCYKLDSIYNQGCVGVLECIYKNPKHKAASELSFECDRIIINNSTA